MSVGERRQPGARVPFEALVEIAAPGGASFEAESVDLSSSGMQLRTAYLPKIGAPLTFRFDAGDGGDPVMVRGEVAWCQDQLEDGGGGEFGVRFDMLGSRETEVIQKIIGISANDSSSATFTGVGPAKPGLAVRVHIEGMPAPMRAILRSEGRDDRSQPSREMAIVSSELKMLRLGAVVELEDKERKTRRAASVDGVDCEIDPTTRVPQLIVKLRYEDVRAAAGTRDDAHAGIVPSLLPTKKVPMPADVENAAHRISQATSERSILPEAPKHEAMRADASQQRVSLPVARDGQEDQEMGDDGDVHDDDMHVGARDQRSAPEGRAANTFADKMKLALGGAALAASRLGARVGTTVALLSKKSGATDDKDDGDARRTTSAFTREGAGGAGRPRTLRQQGASRDGVAGVGMGAMAEDEEVAMQEIDSKKMARRRQIGIASGVGIAVVLGFLAFRKPHKEQPIVQAPAPELAPAPPPAAPPLPAPAPADTLAAASIATPAPPLVGDSTGVDAKGNPNPFGTTSVKKGTKMLLRLDGPVTEIKGMQMPNGFVVSVPNRKSLEAAGPLAAKDPRIGSAKVVNQPGGAELTIAFKDGSTPTYIVKAKGDAIEIVLAHEKAVAKKKGKGSVPAKAPHKKK